MMALLIQIIAFTIFFAVLVGVLIVAARKENATGRQEPTVYTKRPSESYCNYNRNPEAKP